MRAQFVGRRGELDELTYRLRAGTGQVVLVSGEPGIGKTRLAHELTAVAEANGVLTSWGRAVQDDGGPSYWPFRMVLKVLARLHAPGALAGDLSLLVPEFGDGPAMSPGERFRVFEAVTEYLTGVGKVLIVLDDLQWADPPTVQLLVHLARAIGSAPVMILVTYRDTEVSPALSDGLASLAREETVSRIRLGTCGRRARPAVGRRPGVDGRGAPGRCAVRFGRLVVHARSGQGSGAAAHADRTTIGAARAHRDGDGTTSGGSTTGCGDRAPLARSAARR